MLTRIKVFPLRPGRKTPPGGLHWRDPGIACEWGTEQCKMLFDTFEPTANYAIVCGEVSNMVVLDFDTKNGKLGMATADFLLGEGWQSLYGWQRTPSGGAHVAFRWVPEWGNRKFAHIGLDIQGNGSYIVGPGSVLSGEGDGDIAGRYESMNGGLQRHEPPDSLLAGIAALFAEHGKGGEPGPAREPVAVAGLPDGWEESVEEADRLALVTKLRGHVDLWNWWTHGDYDKWDGKASDAIYVLARQLFKWGFKAPQVLWLLYSNEHCYLAASSGNREGREGLASADWLWRYNVLPAEPPSFAASVSDGAPEVAPVAPQTPVPRATPVSWGPVAEPEVSRETPVPQAEVSTALDTPFDQAVRRAQMLTLAEVDGFLREMALHGFAPHEVDALIRIMAGVCGVRLKAMRDSWAQVKREFKAAMKADGKLGAAVPPRRYVYIIGENVVWDTWTRTVITPTAFGHTYGKDAATAQIEGGAMDRCMGATYVPHNIWAPGWDGAEPWDSWLWVEDVVAGEPRVNRWVPPATRPLLGAGIAHAAVWWQHLRGAGTPEEPGLGLVGGVDSAWHLVRTMAFQAQYPEVKVNHAVLLGGGTGIGKDWVLWPLLELFGAENTVTVGMKTLRSGYDPDVSAAKVMRIPELNMGSKDGEQLVDDLKPFCAAPPDRLPLTLKYAKGISVPNVAQLWCTTNHRDSLAVDGDDRRWWMEWGTAKGQGEAFWVDMWRWMTEPVVPGPDGAMYTGGEAVAGFLLGLDVSGYNPGARPPVTRWKTEQTDTVADPMAELLDDWWAEHVPEGMMTSVSLRDRFSVWLQSLNELRFGEKLNAKVLMRLVRSLGGRTRVLRLGTGDSRKRVKLVAFGDDWDAFGDAAWSDYAQLVGAL